MADDFCRRTLDSLLQGFQIIGLDWRYVYVNRVAARHGGSTPPRLMGRLIWDAYPGIEKTPLFDALRRCMVDRTSAVFENHFTFPDGESRWFEIRIQSVPEGIAVYSADIHERKLAELAVEQAHAEWVRAPVLTRLWRCVTGSAAPWTARGSQQR